jgi:SAM-dependent methyltransferase
MAEFTRLEQALHASPFDNDLEAYFAYLDIDKSDLQGLVLDIGSCFAEAFSREAAEEGIQVVSLNPHLASESSRMVAQYGWQRGQSMSESITPWQRRSVAGLAQELPFADNTFDTIVSVAALPAYISPDDYET